MNIGNHALADIYTCNRIYALFDYFSHLLYMFSYGDCVRASDGCTDATIFGSHRLRRSCIYAYEMYRCSCARLCHTVCCLCNVVDDVRMCVDMTLLIVFIWFYYIFINVSTGAYYTRKLITFTHSYGHKDRAFLLNVIPAHEFSIKLYSIYVD